MEKVIGIVGSSGKIGALLSEILSEKYKVIGGQRHAPETYTNKNFTYNHLDIYDKNSLESFCRKCSLVINCAGPSYVIKDTVMNVCVLNGVKYADLSGDMLFEEKYQKFIDDNDGECVVGSGFVAGMSAIMPLYYGSQYFDKVNEVKCFQGSRDCASRNSIIDIILSSVSDSGYAGCYYNNGKIIPETEICNDKQEVTGFPESVILKPYLSDEMKKAAEIGNFNSLKWYNAMPDMEIAEMAGNIFSAENTSSVTANSPLVEKYLKVYNAIASTRPLWNVLAYEISGTKNNENIYKRIICHIKSGYKVCAVVASVIAENMLASSFKGIHWGFEAADGREIISRLKYYDAVYDIVCSDFIESETEEEEIL